MKREASEASAVEASGNRAVQAYPTLSSSPRLFPPSLSNHIVGPPPQRDFGSAHPTWTASDAHACFAAQMHGAWRRSDSTDSPSLPPSHTSPQLAIGPSVLAILPSSPTPSTPSTLVFVLGHPTSTQEPTSLFRLSPPSSQRGI
ncbi:hypothetical protein PaG_06503 [Moesziomyces aphidis]|uniref:Uncharacterized protein n=1 Tax=Moesziomyces aphidis TaxID=84754 RepID=W3VFR4_MOEAP|nr:hypothetical protein PaG_06503 [Moesziomyces aphidis]